MTVEILPTFIPRSLKLVKKTMLICQGLEPLLRDRPKQSDRIVTASPPEVVVDSPEKLRALRVLGP